METVTSFLIDSYLQNLLWKCFFHNYSGHVSKYIMAAILDCHMNWDHVDTEPNFSTLYEYYQDNTIYEVKNDLKQTFALRKIITNKLTKALTGKKCQFERKSWICLVSGRFKSHVTFHDSSTRETTGMFPKHSTNQESEPISQQDRTALLYRILGWHHNSVSCGWTVTGRGLMRRPEQGPFILLTSAILYN